jgi:hypothetical protein
MHRRSFGRAVRGTVLAVLLAVAATAVAVASHGQAPASASKEPGYMDIVVPGNS